MTNTFVHHGKAGFNALGFDPDVDPDQQLLEFDFGTSARTDSVNAAVEQLPRFIREDTSSSDGPVTIGELFRARCNDTPLTMPLVGEAVVKLRDELEEVEILGPDGKIRPKASSSGGTIEFGLESSALSIGALETSQASKTAARGAAPALPPPKKNPP